MKGMLRKFLPPILWEALRSVSGRGSASAVSVSSDSYRVRFASAQFGGNRYFVPEYASDRPAAIAILNGRLYEPDTHILIARVMERRPGSMVHAGTFFGDMVPSFSKTVPSTLYAFEPVLENFVLAKLCVQANLLENVVLVNSGLGSAIRPAFIDTGEGNAVHMGGASRISARGQHTCLTTIDSFQIEDLSVLQLDVEGHELEALKGARNTIERCKPVILLEDNNKSCSEFLATFGYSKVGSIPGLDIYTQQSDASIATDLTAKTENSRSN